MSKIDQSLSEVFGVEPLYNKQEQTNIALSKQSQEVVPVSTTSSDDEDLDMDIAMIRNNIHTLIRSGQEAFESVIHIAKAEERISAFEVGNSYLSNLAAINMQLLSLHEKKKKIKEQPKDKPTGGQIVNNGGTTNIAFVGTTKEMMAHMSKQGMIQPPAQDDDDDGDTIDIPKE